MDFREWDNTYFANIYQLNTDELREQFMNSKPYNHIVLDNMVNNGLLKLAEKEIRSIPETEWSEDRIAIPNWQKYAFNKRYISDITKCGALSKKIYYHFVSEKFENWLHQVTGIKAKTMIDHSTGGSGLHRIKKDGLLEIHADFNIHWKTGQYRRLNCLLYINSNYKEEYNGHLELWDDRMMKCEKKIAPLFNRMVIFRVTDDANHGHPVPWNAPEGYDRISFAFYYYTNDRPEYEKSSAVSVQFKERPIPRPISPPIPTFKGNNYELVVFSFFRNEALYLKEWITHYLSEGVTHFYLMNDNSTDNYEEILSPYMNLITLKTIEHDGAPWRERGRIIEKEIFKTSLLYKINWFMWIDADEFLYGRKGHTLLTYLQSLSPNIGQIYCHWKIFVSSENTDPSHIVDSLTKRVAYPIQCDNILDRDLLWLSGFGKSIIRPKFHRQTGEYIHFHNNFSYGKRIDNYGNEIITEGTFCVDNIDQTKYTEKTIKEENIAFNHYMMRSYEDFQKRKKGGAYDGKGGAKDGGEHNRNVTIRALDYINLRPYLLTTDNILKKKKY